MGDFRACESSAAAAVSDSDPPSISREIWDKAEERTDEILCRIRPTVSADRNRREVFEYVRGLITGSLGCEVFPYGSVPLKTYLPDGDIDLTAISTPNIENTLFSDVYAVLKGEEHNRYAYFEVKDVHFIDAEVKLVKCLVQNIVIDISFNQLGGLCTLCFLEKVDGLIGKDHLFKRSIILIKAWCYYESRILGAHHGLISTYALETLVLHVFHLFHSSLNGPLAVLYRFLDYFSKFDWENYCVSLSRPVCKSSLPDVLAKLPENGRDDLLLSEEFLQDCVDRFSAPSKGIETNPRSFPQKHLNIIDALKENNNLGRSVNRGNFYRIRSAFKYGACKLGQILSLPRERLADELNHFFANTLERHTIGATNAERSDTCHENSMFLKSTTGHHNDMMVEFKSDEKRRSSEMVFSQALPEMKYTLERNSVSENNRSMDAKGILSSRNGHKLSNMLSASSDFRTSFLGEESNSAPHCNGKIEIRNPYGRMLAKSAARDDTSFAHQPESIEGSLVASNSIGSYGNNENVAPRLTLSIPALNMSENSSSDVRERNSARNLGNSASLKSLLDLHGHYEIYFSNLIYSKHYHFDATALPSPVSNQLHSKSIWESTQQQSPWLELRLCSDMKENGGLGPQSYPVNPPTQANALVSSEEQKNSQGTGTYFPKVNYHSNKDQPSSHGGRFPAPEAHGQLQRHALKSSLVTVPTEMNLSGEISHELSQEEYPVLGNATSSDFHRLFPSVWCSLNASDPSHSSETHESRFQHLKLSEVSLPEESSSPSSDTCSWDSTSSPVVPTVQSPDEDRVAEQSFHLKNEVDFPPLSLGRMVKT